MTREAKIGMLTGLGVIVLIGVLLSDYLGDARGAGASGGIATGHMAPLPIGADYRQQMLDPVAVPAMTRTESLVAGNEMSSPIAMNMGVVPPAAYATESTTPQGPMMGQPVSPQSIGPAPVQVVSESGAPPIISLDTPASSTVTRTPPQASAPAQQTTYVIAAGDTLGKIARKFYNASKSSDIQRIVAANPTMLKDAATPLVVNKKLIIPSLPAPVAAIPPSAPAIKVSSPVAAKKADPAMIYLPGPLTGKTEIKSPKEVATQVILSKKAVTKTYEIKSGDTLEKVARKNSPSNVSAYVEKLKTLNGIKDPSALAIGAKLKLPA